MESLDKAAEEYALRKRYASTCIRFHEFFLTVQAAMEKLRNESRQNPTFPDTVEDMVNRFMPAIDKNIRIFSVDGKPPSATVVVQMERLILWLESRFLPIMHYSNLPSTFLPSDSFEQEHRDYCRGYINVAKHTLSALDAVLADATLVASVSAQIVATAPAARQKLEANIIRAGMELAKPRLNHQILLQWHHELMHDVASVVDAIVRHMEYQGHIPPLSLPKLQLVKASAKLDRQSYNALRQRFAECCIHYHYLLRDLAMGEIGLKYCGGLRGKHEDFYIRFKQDIEELGIFYQSAIMALADPQMLPTELQILEMENNLFLHDAKLRATLEFSKIYLWRAVDGKLLTDSEKNRRYALECLRGVNLLQNQLVMLKTRKYLVPVDEKKFQVNYASLRADLEQNIACAMNEINKPVFEISRRDLTINWYDKLGSLTVQFARDIVGQVVFSPPPVDMTSAVPKTTIPKATGGNAIAQNVGANATLQLVTLH